METGNHMRPLGQADPRGYWDDDDPWLSKRARRREIRQLEKRQWRQEAEEALNETEPNNPWE